MGFAFLAYVQDDVSIAKAARIFHQVSRKVLLGGIISCVTGHKTNKYITVHFIDRRDDCTTQRLTNWGIEEDQTDQERGLG